MERKYINAKFKHFLHGADYNPEQWIDTKEIWDMDMQLLNDANCNELTVGIFSWAELEPEEGKFDFSFLDEIIDKIDKNGGKVVLATPSAARPRWMAEKYPEVNKVEEDLVRNHYKERHNFCPNSPIYREKVTIINTLLAERYGKHPAVVAWHLSNEYSGTPCYCPICQQKFRDYLRKKFDNDIEKLNHEYWSGFWSHRYTSFDQIEAPHKYADKILDGLMLDWQRFCSDSIIDFIHHESEPLKRICPDIPRTTNLMPGHKPLNHYKLKDAIDVISWDSYPNWESGDNISVACDTSFWHKHFRSLKLRPFMLMESCPGLVNWKDINKLKRPGMDKLASISAIAQGSDTVQYFQWRKGRGGVEKFHGAVVDHVGTNNTRIFGEVKRTGELLKIIDEVAGSNVISRVAIVYDWENRWALDNASGFCRPNKKYTKTCLEYHRVLWQNSISADIIGKDYDFSKYDLIILPMMYICEDYFASKLEDYVKNGGTLFATYMLGMVNENDLCHLGGFPAGNLKEVFGIWNEEIDTLYATDRVELEYNGKTYKAKDYMENIHSNSCDVLATFKSDFLTDCPAFTVKNYGKGKAYYQAFRDEGDFKEEVLSKILSDLNIVGAIPNKDLVLGVTAHKRVADGVEYLFVENYTGTIVYNVDLGDDYVDFETGATVNKVDLGVNAIKVFKKGV